MRILLAFLVLFTLAGCDLDRVPGPDPLPNIFTPGRTQALTPGRTQAPAATQAPEVTRADLAAAAANLAATQAAWDAQQQASQEAWLDRIAYAALALAVLWACASGLLIWWHLITPILAFEVGTPLVVVGLLLLELSHYLPRSGPWLMMAAAAAAGVHFLAHHWRTLRPALTKRADALAGTGMAVLTKVA